MLIKRKPMKNFFIIALTLIPFFGYSQTETVTIYECEIDTINNQYDKLFTYFIADKEEVKRLWKFNAVDWAVLNPSLALEQKLGKKSSLEVETKIFLGDYIGFVNGYIYNGWHQPKATIYADYRLYTNLLKRERKGKPTNGFSANYFSAGILGGYGKLLSEYTDHVDYYGNNYYENTLQYRARLAYGIQRRIGSIAYFDVKIGFQYIFPVKLTEDYYTYGDHSDLFIDLNFGIALKSLKRPLFK